MAIHPLVRLLFSMPPHVKVLLFTLFSFVVLSFLSSLLVLFVRIYGHRLRSANTLRRKWLLHSLMIADDGPETIGRRRIVGFFHPYCNAGGGGERVLWAAIACLQREDREVISVIYTGDAVSVSKEDILSKVQNRFGLCLDGETLIFVPLRRRWLVEASTYPRFTMLGQSIGSIFLAIEGLRYGLIPDIWVDTMGYAFAYPFIQSLGHIPIASYTHYPTISTDMLRRVHDRQPSYTNQSWVASSNFFSYFKLFYYLIFSELYSVCLQRADVLMVNSSWTKNHIDRLFRPFGYRDDDAGHDHDENKEEEEPRLPPVVLVTVVDRNPAAGMRQRATGATDVVRRNETSVNATPGSESHTRKIIEAGNGKKKKFKVSTIVYPPCDTKALSSLPIEARENLILSIAQFRPEKDHATQLYALRLFLDSPDCPPEVRVGGANRLKLIMAGSVRDAQDENRVHDLKDLRRKLNLQDYVDFAVNLSHPDLVRLLARASIGLHTMVDEHFGITVVEFMAAGLIPLVHASAGPLLDIVIPYESMPTGFHATSPQDFANQIQGILSLPSSTLFDLRSRARSSALARFTTEKFEAGWWEQWQKLIKLEERRRILP